MHHSSIYLSDGNSEVTASDSRPQEPVTLPGLPLCSSTGGTGTTSCKVSTDAHPASFTTVAACLARRAECSNAVVRSHGVTPATSITVVLAVALQQLPGFGELGT